MSSLKLGRAYTRWDWVSPISYNHEERQGFDMGRVRSKKPPRPSPNVGSSDSRNSVNSASFDGNEISSSSDLFFFAIVAIWLVTGRNNWVTVIDVISVFVLRKMSIQVVQFYSFHLILLWSSNFYINRKLYFPWKSHVIYYNSS